LQVDVKLPHKLAFLAEKHRYKVAYGGRGSAKSWSFVIQLLINSLEKKLRILCCREVQKSIKDSVHRLIGDQIQRMGLGSYFEITEREIRCKRTGSVFLFAGLANNTVESIKSFEGVDICYVEEAQTVSERSWQILLPTIRSDDSEVWIAFNPELATDPTYVRFVTNASQIEDCVSVEVNYDDNPYFPAVLRAEMEQLKANDIEAYNHIWLGKCKQHGNAVIFKGKYVSYDFTDKIDPESWSPFYGADWGFANDPTTFIKSWVYERVLYIEHEMFAYQLETDMAPAQFDLISDGRLHISRADCARPETISYMKRNGYKKMIPSKKWPGSVEDGVDYMRSFDLIVIHPRCVHLLEEFRLYSYKVDRLSGDILPEIVDRFNHGIDAISYSLEPLILGYKKKIAARPTPKALDSLGREVSMARIMQPNMWIS